MNDGYAWWLLLVGIGVGVALVWLVLARLPRDEADLDADGQRVEAAWISHTIERRGGVAPPLLVEEILELHGAYVSGSSPYGVDGPGDGPGETPAPGGSPGIR